MPAALHHREGTRDSLKRPDPELFAEGIDLFNAGKFFEAHEVWEEIWKHSSGEEKLFYQGIIQAAAAMVHVQRDNPAGAQSMYLKARAKLDLLPAEHMGIALGELRDDLRKFFARLNDPAPFPKIRRL